MGPLSLFVVIFQSALWLSFGYWWRAGVSKLCYRHVIVVRVRLGPQFPFSMKLSLM
jgi:hypothetical protein